MVTAGSYKSPVVIESLLVQVNTLILLHKAIDEHHYNDFVTYDKEDLYDIDLCCLHLQVNTLSVITDPTSKAISKEIFQGTKNSDHHFSPHQWPPKTVCHYLSEECVEGVAKALKMQVTPCMVESFAHSPYWVLGLATHNA
jgi:hypothetical protein